MGRWLHKQLLDGSNSLDLRELGRPGNVPCLSTGVLGHLALEGAAPYAGKTRLPSACALAPGFPTASRVSNSPSLFLPM